MDCCAFRAACRLFHGRVRFPALPPATDAPAASYGCRYFQPWPTSSPKGFKQFPCLCRAPVISCINWYALSGRLIEGHEVSDYSRKTLTPRPTNATRHAAASCGRLWLTRWRRTGELSAFPRKRLSIQSRPSVANAAGIARMIIRSEPLASSIKPWLSMLPGVSKTLGSQRFSHITFAGWCSSTICNGHFPRQLHGLVAATFPKPMG
jgi:hypothetical protein